MWGKAREHLLGKSNLFETNTLMHPCSKKGCALEQTLKMRISSPARGQPQFSGDLWVSQGKALAFFTQETQLLVITLEEIRGVPCIRHAATLALPWIRSSATRKASVPRRGGTRFASTSKHTAST